MGKPPKPARPVGIEGNPGGYLHLDPESGRRPEGQLLLPRLGGQGRLPLGPHSNRSQDLGLTLVHGPIKRPVEPGSASSEPGGNWHQSGFRLSMVAGEPGGPGREDLPEWPGWRPSLRRMASMAALVTSKGMKLQELSRDGDKALFRDEAFNNCTFMVYGTDTGQLLETISATEDGSWEMASFSPDGNSLALTGGRGLALMDLRTGQMDERFQGNGLEITSLACAPDRNLAVLAAGLTFSVWDLGHGTCLRTFKAGTAVISAGFAPGGGILVTGHGDGTLKWWDPTTGRELNHLTAHQGEQRNLRLPG